MLFCRMDVAPVMKKMRLSSMVAVDGEMIENKVCCSISSVMEYLSLMLIWGESVGAMHCGPVVVIM